MGYDSTRSTVAHGAYMTHTYYSASSPFPFSTQQHEEEELMLASTKCETSTAAVVVKTAAAAACCYPKLCVDVDLAAGMFSEGMQKS